MNKLAVIVSLYNKESVEHISMFMDSMNAQTYKNFVLYICFDGPLDQEKKDVIYSYRDLFSIVVIENKENKGLAYSLNRMIDLVIKSNNIAYIARMDTDDICFPERFEKQIAFMNANEKISVSGTWCIEFNEVGEKFLKKMDSDHDLLVKSIFKKSPFIHPTVIFRKNVFMDGIRYRVDTYLSEDLFLWIQLIDKGFYFGNIQEPLLLFRTSESLYHRRKGINKAFSELKGRFNGMKKLNALTLKNIYYSLSYFALRLMPVYLIKIAYKYLR